MTKDECYFLGTITKTNGYKGGVNIYLDVDNPFEYENLDAVFVDFRGSLIPYFIHSIQIHNSKNTALVYFEDIDHIDDAQNLVKSDLYLPLNTLPKKEGNHFYFHEIIGFSLVDEKKGLLGSIDHILDYPQQALFQITYKGKEVLIPVNDHVILEVRRNNKEILVKLPEGLLEVYLEEDNEEKDE
jgi:16S rRNA processing protein RimM